MSRVGLRCGQAKGGDDGEPDAIADGDGLRLRVRIDRGDGGGVARVEFDHGRLFVNQLRLVIAHLHDLVGDLVEVHLADGDADEFFAAELHAAALDGRRSASGVAEGIVGKWAGLPGCARVETGLGSEVGDQRLPDGDFVNAVFGERDADGVADAVAEQRADADGALDSRILAFTGLGDAEMDSPTVMAEL